MHPLLRRRLPGALAVTAVCLLVFGSGAGFAASTHSEDVPETFQTEPPRAGDRWNYEGNGSLGPVWSWSEAEPWRHPNGTWHVIHRLGISLDGGVINSVEWLRDADAGTIVAQRIAGSLRQNQSLPGPVPLLSGSDLRMEGSLSQETYETSGAPCGLLSPFAGGSVRLDAPVLMPGCSEASFEAVGMDSVGGLQALHLRSTDDDGTFDVWFASHVPVAVRVAFSDDNGTQTVDLVGFEPGVEPLGAADVRLPDDPMPPLRFTQRPAWGLDDRGVELDFPLSEAWAAARDDPLFNDFRDRLAEHPELHAVGATRSVSPEGDVSWWLQLSDDEARFQLLAARRYRDDPLAAVQPHQDEFLWSGPLDGRPQEAPDRIPTAASLLARWNALHPERPGNLYEFSFDCEPLCDDWSVVVGHARSEWRRDAALTGGTSEYETEEHTLELTRGTIPVRSLSVFGSTLFRSSQLGEPTPMPEPPETSGGDGPALLATTWAFPTPPAAAGVAGAAFLLGVLYWLWPLVKSGGILGLFSRIRSNALLEHPNRAALHDAIRAQPGITHSELVRRLGRGKGVADHHLGKLRAGGLVTVHRSAGRTCYFVPGATHHGLMRVLPHVSPAGARVLSYAARHPGCSPSDASRALGLAASTVSHHAKRLREAGLMDPGPTLRPTGLGTEAARVAVAAT